MYHYHYLECQTTPWAIKRSQLIFLCNFVKNQWILMQFSLLDLQMNVTCDIMNFTHLTWLVLLHYLVKNWKCNITVGYYQRKLHQMTIASSKWTRVVMCLKFTFFACCTAMRVWNKDVWCWRPLKTLDANLVWLWPGYHRQCEGPVAWPSKICACWWWTL